jgi:Domain of unknown function (DUF4338)
MTASRSGRAWTNLAPDLGDQKKQFIRFCSHIESEMFRGGGLVSAAALKLLRNEAALGSFRPHALSEIKLRLVKNVILDLIAQGWLLKVEGGRVKVRAPSRRDDSPADEKERIRKGHLLERDAQLSRKAVSEFVRNMERKRLSKMGWHSVFSLMRDGGELSEKLRQAAAHVNGGELESAFRKVVSPYLQFVDGEAVCEHTGLKLRDIWRYFRLTWVNNYKSLPGRSMMILIRDAAVPNHPVIGIAALGSSVVQQKVRDQYIGWDPQGFTERLIERPTAKAVRHLHSALDHLIGGIYLGDFLNDAELEFERRHILRPTHSIIERLRRESKSAREMHQLSPHISIHKAGTTTGDGIDRWEERARTMLFRSKRCLHLATLLSIRKIFQEHGFVIGPGKPYEEAVNSNQVRWAIGQLVRLIKAEHVGIDMLDITVCGAVAPYNVLLGGKLVCMLLASPEIVNHYSTKYGSQASIIASSMNGAPVRRRHNLALLCTTSLYGVGSSQYNRVRIPAEALGGRPADKIEYIELGSSVGFGSFHFSQETHKCIKFLLGRKGSRRVNSIFGEGVNPLMRKIREALDFVGLPSEEILWHGNQRVVYAVPLANNFREVLLGFKKRPSYFVPQTKPHQRTKLIADYWLRRWLSSRINTPGVFERVAEHTLTHPIRHGARVPMTHQDFETGFLWDVQELK